MRANLPLPEDIDGGVRNIDYSTISETNEGDVKKLLTATSLIAILGMSSAAHAEGSSETLMLQFLGTATGGAWSDLSAGTVATIQSLADESADFDVASLDGLAFFEIDFLDASSGVVSGVGVDCLAPDDQGDGLIVGAHSFFILPGGAFVANGMTSVRPFFPGVGDAGGEYTHMTGSVPGGDEDNIIAATDQFEDVGAIRVSGVMNLSEIGSGVAVFNCLWQADVAIAKGA